MLSQFQIKILKNRKIILNCKHKWDLWMIMKKIIVTTIIKIQLNKLIFDQLAKATSFIKAIYSTLNKVYKY